MPLQVALRIAYDGARFASYARNPGTASVETALIEALAHEGLVEGTFRTGSRTDAGVSAMENVVAATLDRPHLRGLVPALQARLPDGLWATGAARVPGDWNPRHAAWRSYRLLHPRGGEGIGAMRQAAAAFLGTHDVRAFARLEAGRDPKRTVRAFGVRRAGPDWAFTVRGESFLWNQVRRMVGATLAVGRGEASPADVAAALASGKPHPRFGLAPAGGLLLERVRYAGLHWDPAAGQVGDSARESAAAMRARAAVAAHVARLGRHGSAAGKAL